MFSERCDVPYTKKWSSNEAGRKARKQFLAVLPRTAPRLTVYVINLIRAVARKREVRASFPSILVNNCLIERASRLLFSVMIAEACGLAPRRNLYTTQ
jgi:hypothetical protein